MKRGIRMLSPASHPQNSDWLFFQEGKDTKWTHEENKQFENALAVYDKDTPDRWFKVAAMIPGKTVGDVIKQYRELEEDVSDIEAGLIPIPGYGDESFTLECVSDCHGLNGLGQSYSPGVKRSTATRPSDQERKKGIPWTEEEHRHFLMGLQKYGKGDWRNISRNFVTTRTPTQVASHAQKYFIRQLAGGKDKRRSSIHDITTVNVPDAASPSSDLTVSSSPTHSAAVMQPQEQHEGSGVDREVFEWKQPNEEAAMAYNLSNSFFMVPCCGISSCGTKLQEQNLLEGTVPESELGSHNSFLLTKPMQNQ